MLNFRSYLAQLMIPASLILSAPLSANAQQTSCNPADFNTVIDDTGEYLRTFSLKRRPILHDKFDQLAAQKQWPPGTAIDQGYQFAHTEKTAELDTRARKLLIELDKIGDQSNTSAKCSDLKRLKSVAIELKTVTEAKFSQMMATVNAELAPRKKIATAKPKPQKQPVKQKPKPAKPSPWQTKTQNTPQPPRVVINALPPPEPLPANTAFTAREIREAGRGFFGSISAELASVMQYTFKNYGRPSGYILGTEGGGAFLAGLSFGKGRLNTKNHPPRKVFWQGPTVGYDLGLQGSRVMFLVYNLKQPGQIFKRYAGIGGSAYVVGGVGLTYHKRGKIVLAPIRTGLGLRLGANIGYLKFTPKFSINPF